MPDPSPRTKTSEETLHNLRERLRFRCAGWNARKGGLDRIILVELEDRLLHLIIVCMVVVPLKYVFG